MDELSKSKKLDQILSFLNDDKAHSLNEVQINLDANGLLFANSELRIAINKLHKDEYVNYVSVSSVVTITWEGSLFIELGGYETAILREQREERAAIELREHQLIVDHAVIQNAKRLNQLTRGLLIATVVVALIALAALLLPYLVCQKKCN